MQEFRNKKTIILGEVNTGKTAYLDEILNRFLEEGEADITVIDMAPDSVRGIGGKMSKAEICSTRYLTAQIAAPRLTGRSYQDAKTLARHNARLIEDIFAEYLENPGKVLFINDISLYLQAGNLDKLLTLIGSTPTVIMNGYYGFSLGGGELGERERENMNALRKVCDNVIRV